MASFGLIGLIDNIHYLPNNGGCIVYVSEFKRGYVRSDGVVVSDRYLSWRCLFRSVFVKYINGHFSRGMLVEVKGELYPYAISHGELVDGYSVLGQSLNVYSFPRRMGRVEDGLVKESLLHDIGVPDVESYESDDF